MMKVAFFAIYFEICAYVLRTYIMGCSSFSTGTCGTFNTGLSNIPTTQLTIPWTDNTYTAVYTTVPLILATA
jgi:hypothetical protein